MARLKKALTDIFDKCNDNKEIFKAMIEAKDKGFEVKEITAAMNKRKKELAGVSTDYKRLFRQDALLNPTTRYHFGPKVVINNINGNEIEVLPEGVIKI